MKNKKLKRYLCLSLVLILTVLLLTGCMAANTQTTNADGTVNPVDTANLSTEVKLGVWDYIKLPFAYLLEWLYAFCGNYGLSLILFGIIVKIILLPAAAKSKKSMMKMSRLTPQVKALEAKFGDDKQAYQQAVNELYKREGASGCSGCLWALLPMLILIPLYQIIREPITWLMFHGDASPKLLAEVQNVFINLKNSAIAQDSASALAKLDVSGFYWQVQALPYIGQVKTELASIAPQLYTMNTRLLGVEMATIPNLMFWKYFDINGVWNSIGQFLLPIISGGTNMLSMWLGQKLNNTVVVDEKGQQDAEMAKSANQSNKAMTYMMPLFSVYIGFIAPAGLSIYWITQGLFSLVQDYFLTKYYKKVYDAEDAVKQAKAAEEAAIEAEKERIRAQRRAENPDGIVGAASKKKLQQREKAEQAAKEAAYQASQQTPEEREAAMEARLLGDRPNRRGRNYDPNRYKKKD